jgi:primosomal protein N'
MYLLIIPQSHSIGIHPLTYNFEGILGIDVHIGSLVEITVGKFVEYGVVAGSHEGDHGIIGEIKSIEQIISLRPILAPYQIELIISLSHRYLLPIHRVFSFILTRPVITRLSKKNFENLENPPPYTQKESRTNRLILSHDSIITPEILLSYMTPRTVVVCPDDFSMEAYRLLSTPDTLYLDPDMTDTRRAQAWIDLASGKYTRLI